jgi:hypothetical protein
MMIVSQPKRLFASMPLLQTHGLAGGRAVNTVDGWKRNSIYRFDDDMLVNAHVYGAPAAHSPVLHIRRLPGGRLVDHYQASFERVWDQASAASLPGILAQGERR